MARSNSHVIETRTRDLIRTKIDDYYENGDALFRELSERDYGIDAVIELFDNTNPTGMIALLQIKGTEKTIVPLKEEKAVSCSMSASNFRYALQSNIPVILIYATLSKPKGFYYMRIQDAVNEDLLAKSNNQNSITIRIPETNNAMDNFEGLFELIREYYQAQ
jgi:hypothetical protein